MIRKCDAIPIKKEESIGNIYIWFFSSYFIDGIFINLSIVFFIDLETKALKLAEYETEAIKADRKIMAKYFKVNDST